MRKRRETESGAGVAEKIEIEEREGRVKTGRR